MIALSFSRAELARNCKFAFNQRYILKTPEADSPALQGGGYFHDLAYVYGHQMSSVSSSTGQDLDSAQTAASEAPEGLPYEVSDDIRELFIKWAERTVLEFPGKMRFESRLAFNQAWEQVEWMAEDVFLRMMIDRIDFVPDPTRIVDYKTARALQEVKKLQQRTYAFGTNLALGDKRQDFQVVEEFVRFGVFREEVLTYDDYGNVGDYYLKLAREIEEWTVEDMQPTVSSWCGLCGYKGICPKYEEKITGTDLDVRGVEDAARLAEKIFVDEERNKIAKGILKMFAEEHGGIVFGDQEFGPKVSQKATWPDVCDAIISIVDDEEALDHDGIVSCMTLPKTALEKALKRAGFKGQELDDKVDELVKAHGSWKPEQKFTFHKAKKEE